MEKNLFSLAISSLQLFTTRFRRLFFFISLIHRGHRILTRSYIPSAFYTQKKKAPNRPRRVISYKIAIFYEKRLAFTKDRIKKERSSS